MPARDCQGGRLRGASQYPLCVLGLATLERDRRRAPLLALARRCQPGVGLTAGLLPALPSDSTSIAVPGCVMHPRRTCCCAASSACCASRKAASLACCSRSLAVSSSVRAASAGAVSCPRTSRHNRRAARAPKDVDRAMLVNWSVGPAATPATAETGNASFMAQITSTDVDLNWTEGGSRCESGDAMA